jgi:hypothetical protein
MSPIFELLLQLFPRPFRRQFAAEISEQLRIDLARERSRGLRFAAWFSVASGFDLLRSALAERMRPSFDDPIQLSPQRQDLGMFSGNLFHDLRQAEPCARSSESWARSSDSPTTCLRSGSPAATLRALSHSQRPFLFHASGG